MFLFMHTFSFMFSDLIYSNQFTPWSAEYVSYEVIHDALNLFAENWQEEDEFISALKIEIEKVDLFVRRKEREIESRMAYAERDKKMWIYILADMRELAKFIRLNYKIIEQLVHEHNMLLHQCIPIPEEAVCLDTQRLDVLYTKLTQSTNQSSNESPVFYWIDPVDTEQVRAILLFHLPTSHILPYSCHPVFFDFDHLSYYTSALQADEDSQVICQDLKEIDHQPGLEDGLKAKVFTSYQCLLSYQTPQLLVSLYADVTYSKGQEEKGYSCEYALLETRGDVSQILPDNLLRQVPRFSLFVDGIARLYRDQCVLLPWWLTSKDNHRRFLTTPILASQPVSSGQAPTLSSSITALPTFREMYYHGRNNQSAGYMLTAADEKKKKKGGRIEPKIFMANERTMIHWFQFSVLIMTAALTLLNFGDRISKIAGGTFFAIAIIIGLYAFGRYRYRAYQIHNTPHIRYDDIYGPIGLCCLLVGAIVVSDQGSKGKREKLIRSIA